MTATITEVKSEVLEAGLAYLTGGFNLEGHPIVSFPPECTPDFEQYSAGDLLHLLQYYVRIAGLKISVLLNMREKWTESGITKVITVFDELQSDRRGTVSNVYILKPVEKAKLRVLKKCLLRKAPNGRLLPFYKVHLLETEEAVFSHVDRSQLTVDFGGTLQYNHLAWVDFQKSYATVLGTALTLKNKVKVIKSHVMKLIESEGRKNITDEIEYRQKEIRAKYESILEKHGVRQTIAKSNDALERLDGPDEDANLIQIHCNLLIDTKNKLRDAIDDIQPDIDEMDDAMAELEDEMSILEKLSECKKNTEDVKETINLLRTQITDTVIVGRDLTEAANFRGYFILTALEPSKDIVACATSILKNLDGGSKTTQRTYKIAFDIAKQLTQSIQPFTNLMNQLNEDYTRVHLFHALLEKTIRWKTKASLFIIRNLLPQLNDRVVHASRQTNVSLISKAGNNMAEQPKIKTVTFKQASKEMDEDKDCDIKYDRVINQTTDANHQVLEKLNENSAHSSPISFQKENPGNQMGDNIRQDSNSCGPIRKEMSIDNDSKLEYDTYKSIVLESPTDWNSRLKVFYRKHPAPKKKHLKLLTKYAPVDSHRKLRRKANVLAERSLFILSVLRKKLFKSEEIIRIQQWTEDESATDINTQKGLVNNDTCILEITLV